MLGFCLIGLAGASEAIKMSLCDNFINVNPGTAFSDYGANRFGVACSGLCYILVMSRM